MIYLKAYQAYQAHNYNLCLKLLQELGEDSTKLELQAQCYFNLKEFQKAYDIYKSLILLDDDFSTKRAENFQILLVCAQLEKPGTLKTDSKHVLPEVDEIIDQVEFINLRDPLVTDMSSKSTPKKKVKKNKKRKIRLPKQYDPVAGPDPERWLPRRDRKGNAHKQKKRRQRPHMKGKGRAK